MQIVMISGTGWNMLFSHSVLLLQSISSHDKNKERNYSSLSKNYINRETINLNKLQVTIFEREKTFRKAHEKKFAQIILFMISTSNI